jgi:PKD repeat protein
LTTTLIAPALSPTFTQSSDVIVVGQLVTFTDQSTTNGAPIIARAWDWGDGSQSSGPVVTHAYAGYGDFTVRLTITDTCGCNKSVTAALTTWPYKVYLPVVKRSP